MFRVLDTLRRWWRPRTTSASTVTRDGGGREHRGTPPQGAPITTPGDGYPGDFAGLPDLRWVPRADGRPDPGEVVWTWVPFEEDHTRGKDRPVLLVGVDGPWLLAVPLTSKDHDRDAAQEHRDGRDWVDVGSGAWDRKGRPSEARVDRIVRVDPATVRREGGVLDPAVFAQVAAAIRASRSGRADRPGEPRR